MSTAAPVIPTEAPVATPAPVKLNAIQVIEQKLVEFIKQREQAIANVHAVEGAIQGAQNILATFRAEAAKAEAEVKKLAGEAEAEVVKMVEAVKQKI